MLSLCSPMIQVFLELPLFVAMIVNCDCPQNIIREEHFSCDDKIKKNKDRIQELNFSEG